MCMGFGCNAVGVTGCRIIDSPRERLLAILTNAFVPCNGRFPAMIAVITMFFAFGMAGVPALILTLVLIFGVVMTFAVTRLLSKTLLRGKASSFILELPPYRTPQVGQVIVRSLLDRTLFVLGRAVSVAAPAGLVIWIMANVTIGNVSLLNICADFLNPFANLLGLDGIILMAFILGFPANEIVIPIIIMAYTASGTVTDVVSLGEIKEILVQNGWTWITAVNMVIFTLFHWPCSTTLITVKKETGSLKWTALAAALPTAAGVILCFLFTSVCRIFEV
ncbi:MAG: ferrous iron transporter B [Oscillospiraceae bacterium]|nr:ferrous iron transporter B [Oscillospiraceae bacterium]